MNNSGEFECQACGEIASVTTDKGLHCTNKKCRQSAFDCPDCNCLTWVEAGVGWWCCNPECGQSKNASSTLIKENESLREVFINLNNTNYRNEKELNKIYQFIARHSILEDNFTLADMLENSFKLLKNKIEKLENEILLLKNE